MVDTIKVFPNPWGVNPYRTADESLAAGEHSLNVLGEPSGTFVDAERMYDKQRNVFIGAEICSHQITHGVSAKTDPAFRSSRQITSFSFLGIPATDEDFPAKLAAATAVEVPRNAYYIGALLQGRLIAASAGDARRLGLSRHATADLFEELHDTAQTLFLRETT